jgi:hypothetical protein
MSKECFKCHKTQPLSQFYTHPKMGDGHLGKCKTCAKRDVSERIAILVNNPEWLAKERARCRVKQERYRNLGVAVPVSQEARRKWSRNNRHKKRAQCAAGRAVRSGKIKKATICERCGAAPKRLQKHHPDYSKPLEIIWLCSKCHGIAHRK